ncbi:MAG: LLM class F420-dependent oxidoreductase [Mycobacterium sp.]|nr:LLM class F420-dependent oxidoreductase [Mycobacterium sp.]
MKFAVFAPLDAGLTADPRWMTLFAQHLEACGFESIVVAEHTVMVSRYDSVYPYDESGRVDLRPDCPVPDPLDLLAFLAGRTDRLGLATGVLVLPNHHPVAMAKRAATVDVLSGGRLRLCVGVGWLKEEVEACGTDFGSRGRRTDEQLQVMRMLWDGPAEGVSHRGEFFAFEDVVCRPKPLAHLPVHIGGHSRAAAVRAGRYGDGFQPLGVDAHRLAELIALMRDEAAGLGRDSEALEVSLGHQVSKINTERAARLAAIGADRVVLARPAVTDIDEARDMLSACADRLGLTP